MRLRYYHVDAFTDHLFGGNPAGVVPLDAWIPDDLMQSIAAENRLSETAFTVREGDGRAIRWFTPEGEVELCGHATLATAFILATEIEPEATRYTFQTRKVGPLTVDRRGEALVLNFPAWVPTPVEPHPDLLPALGGPEPVEVLAAADYLVVYETAEQVQALKPDVRALRGVDRMVTVTAPGAGGVDFVSRFFAPFHGIDEDPVTGRAHCMLTPYWTRRLGARPLEARQVSARGGVLTCALQGDRVEIAGRAVLYKEGTIIV